MNQDTKVLIVDKHEPIRKLIKKAFHKLDIKGIIEVQDGSTAIIEFNENPIDLIVCGWNLYDMKGLDFLKVVRNNQNGHNTAVVMITEEMKKEWLQEAIQLGVNDIILKPFTFEVFIKKIKNILKT